MPSSSTSSATYETLFHASEIDLVIPSISSLPSEPRNDEGELQNWWDEVESNESRSTAYFDEKLFYFVCMTLEDEKLATMPGTPALGVKEPTSEMLRFLGRIQLTMNASFIPPLPSSDSANLNRNTSQRLSALPTSTPNSTLAPPPLTSGSDRTLPPTPRTAESDSGTFHGGSFPPVTPNPFPTMRGEEQYAHVEGVTIWEGGVQEQAGPWEKDGEGVRMSMASKFGGGGGRRRVFRREGGWQVVWRGEVPIAYVRTPIQNPLLALTASVTLRDTQHTKTHRRMALSTSTDTASIRSGTETIRTDGAEYEDDDDGSDDDLARMEEIDLLGGLAGGDDGMPATRLAPSLLQDLSISPAEPSSAFPLSAYTPVPAPVSVITPSTSHSGPSRERGHLVRQSVSAPPSTTLRKSFRRVLSLSPGLRVRMRTLFLPQLLPVASASNDESESEGERRVVLCVEVENTVESSLSNGFEVERVDLEVGGKGGKATAELVCQPQNTPFPLRLGSIEQHNLLYAVSIASSGDREGSSNGVEEAVARSLGRGDDQRPVSITVVGKPYRRITTETTNTASDTDPEAGKGYGYDYPTNTFHSRWNCSLDLAPFYASEAASPQPPRNRNSKAISTPNAIAGDKRYSLAGLLSAEKDRNGTLQSHTHAQGQGQRPRPLLPSQALNASGSRNTSLRPQPLAGQVQLNQEIAGENALLISVKLLPPTPPTDGGDVGIRPLEPFSMEVFVHNRTAEVRRFRLNVPGREGAGEVKVRDVWEKRKRARGDEASWGVEDSILKQLLSTHTASSPPIIPLDNDIRCGPLLPGASLSARIRFVALREGVHRIERLRLVGGGDEVDHIISPVLDVVVGQS